MKRRTVIKTSIFPSSKDTVFRLLRELNTLQYVAAPLATFSPLSGAEDMVWEKNSDFSFHLKLFGVLSAGIHTIHVAEFDEVSYEIYTNESNRYVPVWNHRITLKELKPQETQYTDEVEIYAGWKTPFIYFWAKGFYTHRQRKWIKLLQ